MYEGANVPDGFFDSMTSIKACNIDYLKNDPDIAVHISNHELILKLFQNKQTIPPILTSSSNDILKRIKKKVSDFYSVTALHYLNTGPEDFCTSIF